MAVIMAQLGCYVPAASARISPVDRICTRMGARYSIKHLSLSLRDFRVAKFFFFSSSDHIFAHASTFKGTYSFNSNPGQLLLLT